MRLKNDELGIVYPDQFIPLAEENGYIHALTEIILAKTCRVLRNLVAEGYEITRISVNVSALELRDSDFCGDISRIIDGNGIDSSRIAIELTESRNDNDFMLMKERIEELKGKASPSIWTISGRDTATWNVFWNCRSTSSSLTGAW